MLIFRMNSLMLLYIVFRLVLSNLFLVLYSLCLWWYSMCGERVGEQVGERVGRNTFIGMN